MFTPSKTAEQFVFNITEIEITESGNVIKGYKKGTALTDDGNKITANTFVYNKLKNILTATGNVRFENNVEDLTIYSDKIIYKKNEEKIFTIGNSKAVNNEITITANNFLYNKKLNLLNANQNVKIIDEIKKVIIFTDEIDYYKNE